MSSDEEEVRDILASLAPKIKQCGEEFSAQAVANALYGLQNMSSDVGEVRDVLASLAPKIEGCREQLSAQAVSNASYGLQNMSSDVREVLDVLVAITRKVEGCTQLWLQQDIGNSLYGLQCMDDRVEQVSAMLRAVERQLESSQDTLRPFHASRAIQGLFHKTSPHASRIRELISAKLAVQPESAQDTTKDNILHLASVMLIEGMALPTSVSAAYEQARAEESESTSDLREQSARCKSTFEADVIRTLKERCLPSNFQINTRIVDGLEMDLYFPALQLNVELDGPYHRTKAACSFNSKRDEHLQRKGIHVHRIDILGHTPGSAAEVIADVLFSLESKSNIEDVRS
jgi:very-short-patch-repair endonuclease/quinol monooxygenase YgiN